MNILVTGGLGFVGSHITITLNNAESIIIIDDCSNSSSETFNIIRKLLPKTKLYWYRRSLHTDSIEDIFRLHKITSIIHCAGVKSVSESIQNPLKYYDINIVSTMNLLKMCEKYNVKHFIFSSSATVYGDSPVPYTEESPIGNNIPHSYGMTKYLIEGILKDCFPSLNMSIIILRYFNPVGGYGSLKENPKGIPNNLMPYIIRVANKIYSELSIYGNDYDTIDGTAVRDYIHIMDLADAHVKALEYCSNQSSNIYDVFNIGTGKGISVQQMVDTFIRVNNIDIPYKYVARRSGDLPCSYADVTKAEKLLGFKAIRTLEDMVRDSYSSSVKS